MKTLEEKIADAKARVKVEREKLLYAITLLAAHNARLSKAASVEIPDRDDLNWAADVVILGLGVERHRLALVAAVDLLKVLES